MKIRVIRGEFAICKVPDFTHVNWASPYCFIGKTDQENSLVCLKDDVPANSSHLDEGWSAFRIEGELDFALVGILSRLSTILADAGIGIFAISTYNTDYILTKTVNLERALDILGQAGYSLMD